MMRASPFSVKFTTTLLALGTIAAFGIPTLAQDAPPVHVGYTTITGLPDDWSHHRVVFTNPGTERDAIKNGTHERWLKIVNDPRYVISALKRNLPVQGPSSEDVKMRYKQASEDRETHDKSDHERRERRRHEDPTPNSAIATMHRDWSMSPGSGGHLAPGQFPAKYIFSATSANCSDYIVFPTGLAGSGTQATVVAYNNLYDTTCGTTATRPSVAWAFNTGTGGKVNLSPVLSYDGTQVAYIQTAAGVASLILLKMANSVGTVASPAASTSVANSAYRACTAPCYTPIILNGSPNDTNSAPFYDYNADQMYVGDNSSNLHQFTGVFIGTPAEITGGGNSTGWPQNLNSSGTLTSPVVDVTDGLVFVAGSAGKLYSIPILGGSSMIQTSGNLSTVSVGIVDAPIVDNTPATPLVYVVLGSNNSHSGDGAVFKFLTNFTSGNGGTFVTLGAGSTSAAIYDGDFDNIHYSGTGATGSFYVCGSITTGTVPSLFEVSIASFTGTATTIGTIATAAGTCSPVTEFLNTGSRGSAVTTLGAAITSTGQTAVTVASGTGIDTGDYIQVGTEDMKVTAGGGTTSLTVTRGVLGTATATYLSGANVLIPQLDWMYMSTTAGGSTVTGCPSGGACLYNYYIGSALGAGSAPTTGLPSTLGTSGIVIDNSATATGESQIYFTTLGNQACAGNGTTGSGTGGCALQVSQSGLI